MWKLTKARLNAVANRPWPTATASLLIAHPIGRPARATVTANKEQG
jgi:hypothetical protein